MNQPRPRKTLVLPSFDGAVALASLAALAPKSRARRKSTTYSIRASTRSSVVEEDTAQSGKAFVFFSLVAVVLSQLSFLVSLPADCGFCGIFSDYVLLSMLHASTAREVLKRGLQLSIWHHCGFVGLGAACNALKLSAGSRLPLALNMLLQNVEFVVTVGFQNLVFSQPYSQAQLGSCAVVVLGASVAALWPGSELRLAAAEIFLAFLAFAALTSLLQHSIQDRDDAAQEATLQHVATLPALLALTAVPTVAPDFGALRSSWQPALCMLAREACMYGELLATEKAAEHSSSPLLVHTVNSSKLLIKAIAVTPLFGGEPFPPSCFWLGSSMLLIGTASYLVSSDG